MAAGERGLSRRVGTVFWVFLRLGLTSFGGPTAHLGYFQQEFVSRRGWLSDAEYADLVSLCQFLPGPTSSQVGMAIGQRRAGPLGAVAAWIAFTLPSAVLMIGLALGALRFDSAIGTGIVHGLMVVAVAVVASAVWSMALTLTPDLTRLCIAAAGACVLLVGPRAGWLQMLVLLAGAAAGWRWCAAGELRQGSAALVHTSMRGSRVALTLAAAIWAFVAVACAAGATGGIQLWDVLYRAGALTFGGGHVMLPMLEAGVVTPGWISETEFLAGYGAAQALPGPLFAFAGYVGAAVAVGPGGVVGGVLALVAIFLPGVLLLYGVAPLWSRARQHAAVRKALSGVNAAVVGVLAAALIDPVATSALTDLWSVGLAALCALLLMRFRWPAWLVAVVGALGGVCIAVVQ